MDNKPNILIILSDQQRYDTINAAGYDYMITPNLDKLASEGCVFNLAHSSNPVCMPARHDLLFGMPSGCHGYFQNGGGPVKDYGIPTIPRIFTENGYRTAAIGKMHFHPATMHHGYSEMYLMEELPNRRQDDAYASYLKENGQEKVENIHGVRPYAYHEPQNSQVDGELYETNWIKNKTIEWLDNNGDNPFMLCVGYIKPHPPWDVEKSYKGIYKDKNIKMPIRKSRLYPNSNEYDEWYGDGDSIEEQRKIREAYYSCVTMVDDSVGKIIDHLRDIGKLDNTLIIYTSDHGEMLYDKGYYSKELPYESAVRVPMIVRYPSKFKMGSTCDALVNLIDIFPTCLDVAGLNYPSCNYKLDGESLVDFYNGKEREYIISASGNLGVRRFVMCRSKRYKYIYNYNCAFEEMYDMINDPQELNNIIEKMKDTEEYKSMKNSVIEYEIKWGPDGSVENENLISFNGKMNKGTERGKYHVWSNHQFQKFYEDKENRIERFNYELNKALDGKDISFKNEEWKSDFEKGKEDYKK